MIEDRYIKYNKRPVLELYEDGTLKAEYESVAEASKTSIISRWYLGYIMTNKDGYNAKTGTYYKYKDVERGRVVTREEVIAKMIAKSDQYRTTPKRPFRKVMLQLDYYTNEVIVEYPSLKEAAEKTGVSNMGLVRALRRNEGVMPYAKLKFKYKEI